MNRIITISREFSSGGREVGKRLADLLNYSYLDSQIIASISENTGLAKEYIQQHAESTIIRPLPIHIGRTFSISQPTSLSDDIFIAQNKIINKFAETGNCIIIGRCADQILHDYNPFKIFIYSSDMDKRVERCYSKNPSDKNLSRKDMEKKIKGVDRSRKKYCQYYTNSNWGMSSNYDLCINTATLDIKKCVEIIAHAIK